MEHQSNSPSDDQPRFDRLVAALLDSARSNDQRRALVLAGYRDWCFEQARRALAIARVTRPPWLSTFEQDETWSISQNRALAMLGRDLDALVFDAHSGFDPDAFGAATGAIRGGGLLILLCPPLAEWPSTPDPEYRRIAPAGCPATAEGRFLRRLVEVLRSATGTLIVGQGDPLPAAPPRDETSTPRAAPPDDPACLTEDQLRAVEAVVKVVTGQRRRPAVLISDRGRGKSSALGIAAARLIEQGLNRIAVTGPRLDSVMPVFERAGELLPGSRVSRSSVHHNHAVIEYEAPDELIRTARPADLVLVDEAAAIPTPLLEQLLERFPRIAFATTIHGYEGTGQGFALRFERVLDKRSRGWRAVRLETPVRWAPGDPVERLVFRALALDAAPLADEVAIQASSESCTVGRVDRDLLVSDEAQLGQVFGLLVLAHYRTRPYDLRHLLDGPNVAVYAARHAGQIVATAVAVSEGGFDAETARCIRNGTRRPHGHLLPEAIAAHLGLEQAATLRCLRIMRIAVHPVAARRGIGRRLVEAIVKAAGEGGADYMGSSFGATPELLDFWSACGLDPVRLGATRGASSGAHSAIVLRGLSPAGIEMANQARARFLRHLPDQLTETLRDVDPALIVRLLRARRIGSGIELDAHDRLEIEAFARGERIYEDAIGPVRRQVLLGLTDPICVARLQDRELDALVVKVAQQRAWGAAAEALNLSGRSQVMELIRAALCGLTGLNRHS